MVVDPVEGQGGGSGESFNRIFGSRGQRSRWSYGDGVSDREKFASESGNWRRKNWGGAAGVGGGLSHGEVKFSGSSGRVRRVYIPSREKCSSK